MKFLIIMDSFKGCLSSNEAGQAVMRGIKRALVDAECVVCPIADGGEGTVNALETAEGVHIHHCLVDGPYGESVTAKYLILPGNIAVIEMAQAAGLNLSFRHDPAYASTYGVGMMIRDAIQTGCRRFIVGIGGSATNDGGAGMLQALGVRLLDSQGNPIPHGAIGLTSLASVDESEVIPQLHDCFFDVACDVTTPLLGPHGCSMVFGPQKGASATLASEMDQWLSHYVRIVRQTHPDADPNLSGAGAAGGLGFALQVFCHAKLQRGLPLIANILHLEEKIQSTDYILTGEGRFDAQSLLGKVPVGIASIAKKHHKPVIVLAGAVADDIRIPPNTGIDAVFSIQKCPCTLAEAMEPQNALSHLEDTADQVGRIIRLTTSR